MDHPLKFTISDFEFLKVLLDNIPDQKDFVTSYLTIIKILRYQEIDKDSFNYFNCYYFMKLWVTLNNIDHRYIIKGSCFFLALIPSFYVPIQALYMGEDFFLFLLQHINRNINIEYLTTERKSSVKKVTQTSNNDKIR